MNSVHCMNALIDRILSEHADERRFTVMEGTVTRTPLKKYASRTPSHLAPLILKLHYNAHLAPIRISHPQRSMSHPFASRTTFAYSLTLRPAHLAPAATRTPIRISHPQRSMSHPFASRTTFAYSLTLRPAHLAPAATRTPIRISHPHTHLAPTTQHVAPIRIFNVMTRAC